MKKRTIRLIAILVLAAVWVVFYASCSSSGNYNSTSASKPQATSAPYPNPDYGYESDTGWGSDESMMDAPKGESDYLTNTNRTVETLAADKNRKLIWTGDLRMETKDYASSESALVALIEQCGGYISGSNKSGGGMYPDGSRRMVSAYFTVRVPADKFQYFMAESAGIATVLSSNTSSDDVTDQYFDLASRLSSLRIKEERLLEMLKEAKELEHIITLENELSYTRYEIENLTSSLRRYDGLIEYATVNVSIDEVYVVTELVPEPETVWEQISALFSSTLGGVGLFFQGLFIFVVGYSPVFILLAIIVIAIILITKAAVKSSRKKAAINLQRWQQQQAQQAAQQGMPPQGLNPQAPPYTNNPQPPQNPNNL